MHGHFTIHIPRYRFDYAEHIRLARAYRRQALKLGPRMACYRFAIIDALWHMQSAKALRLACAQTDQDVSARLP
jgi:hypothetical protein